MTFDFDEIFNSNKDEELLNTKLIENSPCKSCEESKFFVNNPYYISEKCNNCKEHAQWTLKCLQKLSLLEDKVNCGIRMKDDSENFQLYRPLKKDIDEGDM